MIHYTELDKVAELGMNEFPITVTGVYDVLIMEEQRILDKYNCCTSEKGEQVSCKDMISLMREMREMMVTLFHLVWILY